MHMEAHALSTHETVQWFDTLPDNTRRACEAELTDAYFEALRAGTWGEFRALVQGWTGRAAEQQLVTA